MLINGYDVLMEDFTIDTEINAVAFKQSSGRTRYRSRGLSYRSNLKLAFDDVDEATEFINGVVSAGEIPMVLEENDISPYGDELEVGGEPPIPAVTVDSFVGDGSSTSYMNFTSKLPSTVASHFGVRFLYVYVGDSAGYVITGTDVYNKSSFYVQVLSNGSLVIKYWSSFYSNINQNFRLISSSGDIDITDGEFHEISIYNNISNSGSPIVTVDGEVFDDDLTYPTRSVSIMGFDSFSSVNIASGYVARWVNTGRGLSIQVGKCSIGEFYATTSVLGVDWESIKDNAQYEEHFTQITPDTLPVDWMNGAIQGEIEISPGVPGNIGILNLYLESAPICKVDGYNKITVELRTLLSKNNITYPPTYNANILNELPYEWKYRENIYNKFNNNVTWGGTNSHSQNSTTGRSIRFDFKLTKTEYLELRKFIFNKRYTPFTYNSLVGDFTVDTLMAIEGYSMSFTGKLYAVTLILEEQ
jgi:hypothetical protein